MSQQVRTAPRITAGDVARYFLAIQDESAGELITHLKLQKLLYYAQGFHLAMFGQPLFDDEIVHWAHGPVVRSVWHEYKRFGSGQIPQQNELDVSRFCPEQERLLLDVWRYYGQFSAWRLREMTHEEDPWKTSADGAVITHQALQRWFATQVEEA